MNAQQARKSRRAAFRACPSCPRPLDSFFSVVPDLDEYLYEHSVQDIAEQADVPAYAVSEWIKNYREN